ncbi:MAG: hypothetical protein JXR31_00420 [Prolixibacteraceae bacterium]|nr:hypothetical protein [Prolixibacteraceae bacterium]MBN2772678.1 hypothetical protein [Prolixibacteraceae bacterium]
MKNYKYIFTFIILLFGWTSCMDQYTEVFTAYSPVYMSYADLRSAVKETASRDLVNTGKIYFKDDYIFINERFEGVHIIDNSTPSNPVKVGFIEIPGNVDIAIKNNILYADSYVDLVAIDISDVNNIEEVDREEDVFPYTVPPTENDDYRIAEVDEEKGVVTAWEIKKVRQDMEYHYYPVYWGAKYEVDMMNYATDAAGAVPQGTTFGIGGSMARFGLYDDYLYVVDQSTLYIFDIKTDNNPKDIGKQNVGWNIETMFIYDNHMFFGTSSGMIVFSLEVPTYPNYIGQFWHVTSCDPVVVSDGYAYVTLRGGNTCGGSVNRLDVLQLSDNYSDNKLLASYPMVGPYGLGIDDQTLFVCDGEAGLKVYDATDKLNIDDHLLSSFPGINAYDVIPVNGNLFMIGEDGFYQYDYSDLQNITLLSFIQVENNE